jgi:hypothetical protein
MTPGQPCVRAASDEPRTSINKTVRGINCLHCRKCPVLQPVKWRDQTARSCCRSGNVVLHRLVIFLKRSLCISFLVKVRSCNRIFAFMLTGAYFTENARIDKQLENGREGLYLFQQTLQKLNNQYIYQQPHLLKYNS